MPLLLSPRHIVTKMEENIKRVDDRVDDFIKDSNENNIHDIRTAIRRLDTSYRSLPKNIRRKNKISKYSTRSKRLFERRHSMSLWHIDWYLIEEPITMHVCDHMRMYT
jgi:hypothetical protein